MVLLALLLALWSGLNWFDFDIVLLWQFSVLSREFGHWLFFVALLVAVYVWRRRFYYPRAKRRAVFILTAIAACSFIRPVYLASRYDAEYTAEVAKLGYAVEGHSLFSIPALWEMAWLKETSCRRIEYTGPDGHALHADFYPVVRKDVTKPPLVVVVHGGGWEGGNTQQLPALNWELAHAGFAVASLSYRFSPATVWPGQMEDIVAGINVLRGRADELGFDPDRLLILGRSAGAQIAGVVAYTRTELPIKGYVDFYGPTDLDFGFEVTVEGDIIDSRNILRRLLSGDPDSSVEMYRTSSVIASAAIRPVPSLLLYGEGDRLVWHKHGERLRRRLIQSGTPVALIDLKWGTHGFDFNPNGPGGQISRNAVITFVRGVLK
ncbi:MAG: alpha/beta hydrolase fold domain-containing protein [Bdellovibrionaceae bacterium]|nr:alpha/beta hydrolase fold domain-containing protein [Pseudobdellovibrionaceae bacterium]